LFIGFLTLTGFLAFPQVIQAKPRLETIITTDIIVDTTWNLAGTPYIIDTGLNIGSGATLTIEARVQVEFNAGKWLDVESGGALVVNGSSGTPVVFTSNAGTPEAGDWYYINVNGGGSATIDYCEIAYGGFNTNDALRIYSTASVTVSNCDIHHNLDEGVLVGGGAGVKPVFTNVTIRDNGGGAVEQGSDTGPVYNNVILTGNADDGIFWRETISIRSSWMARGSTAKILLPWAPSTTGSAPTWIGTPSNLSPSVLAPLPNRYRPAANPMKPRSTGATRMVHRCWSKSRPA
jgi:hypothetical protein